MAKIILIVDDEPDMLAVTAIRLETSGYEILQAASGKEALKVLEGNEPDLILLDVFLPDIQGDTLCRQLKSDAKFKHIPIILFTVSTIRIPANFEEIGADDYIIKPFESDVLLSKIKKIIG